MMAMSGSRHPGFPPEGDAAAALTVACNPAGRWEWILQFEDDVVLPSKRVSDEDYATREQAQAAGEAARMQFARRRA
jgi:hypothetical protein